MAHIRDIQAMMAESRLRKARERERHKQDRIKKYRELCRQADILLRKALEDEKKKRMEQLIALAQKASPKPLKQATEPFIISRTAVYHTNLVERYPRESDLYLTREELMAAEERGEGKINWDIWDKLTNEFIEQYDDRRSKGYNS